MRVENESEFIGGMDRRLSKKDVTEQFIGNIDEFICMICENVIEDMVSCDECESLFCSLCIMKWMKSKKNCPNCKETFQKGKVPRKVKNMLDKTKFYCQYTVDGCKGTFTYETKEAHYKRECIKKQGNEMKCPFKCG